MMGVEVGKVEQVHSQAHGLLCPCEKQPLGRVYSAVDLHGIRG